jgi:glycosyltransferase involved in cell wall biosynthesis
VEFVQEGKGLSLRPLILFLIGNMENGGAERVTATLLRHLDRNRFEAHLAVLSKQGPNLERLPGDVEVHELGGRARNVVFPLIQLCYRLRPRVIFSVTAHLNTAVIACRAFLPGNPAIVVRESTILSHGVPPNSLRARIYRLLYRRADAIVCQSDGMARDLMDNFSVPIDKIVKILNPVDIAMILQLSSGPSPFSEGPSRHLVNMGTMWPVKRHDFLFRVMAEVLKVYPDTKLHLLGTGVLEPELRRQVQFLNIEKSVVFHGFQANPFPFLRNADLYLLTSDYEGLPNALIETLSLGTPAISRNCPGGVSEIARYTSLLRIVDEDYSEAFAEAVIAELACPQKSVAEDLVSMEEHFGVEPVLAKYQELFDQVIRR